MSLTEIPIRLPTDMLNALRTIAHREGLTVNEAIRSLLAQEVLRHRAMPNGDVQKNEALAALRLRLAPLLAQAEDLDSLNWALKELGYVIKPDGDAYSVLTWPVHMPVCNVMDIGISQSRMRALDPEPAEIVEDSWTLGRALRRRHPRRKTA